MDSETTLCEHTVIRSCFLTVSAAGLNLVGLQPTTLRSHTQHHAALLVLSFG